ncbi:MAG: hypothetical protein JWN11_48 [Hyphomicrobiales bacterium]|nr:hypothetical protein [Hyphomicrobiales bacterium]
MPLDNVPGFAFSEAIEQRLAQETDPQFGGPILGHVIVGFGPEKIIVAQRGGPLDVEAFNISPAARTLVFADCRGYGLSAGLESLGTPDEWFCDLQRLADWLSWDSARFVSGLPLLLPMRQGVAHFGSAPLDSR